MSAPTMPTKTSTCYVVSETTWDGSDVRYTSPRKVFTTEDAANAFVLEQEQNGSKESAWDIDPVDFE